MDQKGSRRVGALHGERLTLPQDCMPLRRRSQLWLAVLSWLLLGCESRECYYMANADLVQPTSVSAPDRLLSIHNVGPGRRTVIAIREFAIRSVTQSDSHSYRKITIAIPSEAAQHVSLRGEGVLFRYSEGSSEFAYKGAGDFALYADGDMRLSGTGANVRRIELKAAAQAESASVFPGSRRVEVASVYDCRALQLSEVTPWIGKPDPDFTKQASPLGTFWDLVRFLLRRNA